MTGTAISGWMPIIGIRVSCSLSVREKKEDDFTIILLNFQPDTYKEYKIGVPAAGAYREIFNSDREEFGGSNHINPRPLKTKKGVYHGQEQYIEIIVPPIGAVIFAPTLT